MENKLLITELRENLKKVDENILHLLKQRLDLGRTIGKFKKSQSLEMQDDHQETIVKQRFVDWAIQTHESDEYAIQFAILLMKWNLEVQKLQKDFE